MIKIALISLCFCLCWQVRSGQHPQQEAVKVDKGLYRLRLNRHTYLFFERVPTNFYESSWYEFLDYLRQHLQKISGHEPKPKDPRVPETYSQAVSNALTHFGGTNMGGLPMLP